MNLRTRFTNAKDAVSVRLAPLAAGATALTVSGGAFAQDGFDAASITSAITTNTGIAVGFVGAFILGVWTLRAMGLLKRG